MDIKIVVSVLVSVIASIGIAYFTEKEFVPGAGLCGGLNVLPLAMKAPAGLLMPLEVTQTVVFHILQSAREGNKVQGDNSWNNSTDSKNSLPHRRMESGNDASNDCTCGGFWNKVFSFDPKANILVGIMCLCGVIAAYFAPANRRLEMFWKKIEPDGTSDPNISSFTSDQLPSFDGADIVKVKTMNELDLLEGHEVIVLGTAEYERMKPFEASMHRFETKMWIPISSWILTFVHIVWTLIMLITQTKLGFKMSMWWLLMATLGSGILLHVHSGTLLDILFETKLKRWDWPSLVSTLAGVWWFIVLMVFVAQGKCVTEEIKIWVPVFFIVLTAANGLLYNDEWFTNRNPIPYATSMIVLLIVMGIYSKRRNKIAEQTANDLSLPFRSKASIERIIAKRKQKKESHKAPSTNSDRQSDFSESSRQSDFNEESLHYRPTMTSYFEQHQKQRSMATTNL